MKLLVSLILNGLAVFAASAILSGVQVNGFLTAIIVALLLGIVNALVRPVFTLLTLPVTIFTLGLFLLVINGIMVLLVDSLMDSFQVNGLLWAILFSIVLCFFNLFTGGVQFKGKQSFA